MTSLTKLALVTGAVAFGVYAARGAKSCMSTGWNRSLNDGDHADSDAHPSHAARHADNHARTHAEGSRNGSAPAGGPGASSMSTGSGNRTGSHVGGGTGPHAGSAGPSGVPLGDGAASMNAGEALQRQSRPAMGMPTRDSNDGRGVAPGLGDYARGA